LMGLAEKSSRPAQAYRHGGAVAQLGERLNGIQEVGGSTPLSSTNKSDRKMFCLAAAQRVESELLR
jgi:hypothetical protein